MCIAIVKPVGTDISRDILENCAENNPDGCGFAYINVDNQGKRRLKTRKAMDFDSFYEKYEKAIEQNPESPFLIHFRIKTHGKIDLANCHPFQVDAEHVFIHNGTISGLKKEDDMSDTRVFNRDMLRILPKDWNKNSGIKSLIEEFIGYSKLAVLNLDGEVNIYNEQKGYWIGEVWYSNKSYEKKVPVKSTYNYGKQYTGGDTTSYPFRSGNVGGTSNSASQIVKLENIQSRSENLKYRRSGYTVDSFIPCDYCNVYHKVSEVIAFWQGNSVICFCDKCNKVQDVWYYFDEEDMIGDEAHTDWLNEQGLTEGPDVTMYETAGPWKNPWAEEIEYNELLDEEEAREEAHQLMLEHQGAIQ